MNTQWIKEHWLMSALLTMLVLIVLAIAAVAFWIRDREVSWEEEVLLNTGETIIVKRTMPWVLSIGWSMDPVRNGDLSRQVLRFAYKEKSYSYSGGAAIHWIVIAPDGLPNLVAPALSLEWSKKNNYRCVVPYYVQFKPNGSGDAWAWPNQIEPWLFGQEYNLMVTTDQSFSPPNGRISIVERNRRDRTYAIQSPDGIRINPNYKEHCSENSEKSTSLKFTGIQK
jgi:hypothetical protein